MAETTEKTGEKKLSVTPTRTLSLKGRGVEQGMVKQSFSHGRTKTVVDEEAKRKAEQEAKKRFGEDETKPKVGGALARTQVSDLDEDEAPRSRRPGAARPAAAPKVARPAGGEKRRPRLTVVTAFSADEV